MLLGSEQIRQLAQFRLEVGESASPHLFKDRLRRLSFGEFAVNRHGEVLSAFQPFGPFSDVGRLGRHH